MVPLHQHTLCKGSFCCPPVLWQIRHIGRSSPNEIEVKEHETGSMAGVWDSSHIVTASLSNELSNLKRKQRHNWFHYTVAMTAWKRAPSVREDPWLFCDRLHDVAVHIHCRPAPPPPPPPKKKIWFPSFAQASNGADGFLFSAGFMDADIQSFRH